MFFGRKIMTSNRLCELFQIDDTMISEYRKQGMHYISLGENIIRYVVNDVEKWLEVKLKGECK